MLISWWFLAVRAQTPIPDVTYYDLNLQPDLATGTIVGHVIIRFQVPDTLRTVQFNAGSLRISKVTGSSIDRFLLEDHYLILHLSEGHPSELAVSITYSGKPTRGLHIEPENQLAYTSFFTRDWMICHDVPGDKAILKMTLTVPQGMMAVGSGNLTGKEASEDYVRYCWEQPSPSPPYTYGFVIGKFTQVSQQTNRLRLDYYGKDYSEKELAKIFNQTAEIVEFLESKSGFPMSQNTYSQFLVGESYQELHGLSLLKPAYGQLVLQDSTETNLITHELAHQWWGNSITCESWSHFWLNEAFATFLSAAYNGHRFGPSKYQADIEAYKKVYESIISRGLDKSLVFPDWTNPSRDDRNLVYFKGAYVLHLLRQELGDDLFWKGILLYSHANRGQSVNTMIFQKYMETASNRSLDAFFNKWIYLK